MNPHPPLRIPVILIVLFLSAAAMAQDVFWTNTAGGNWSDGANWNTGLAPQAGDNVFITEPGTYTVTLDADADITSLTVGAASGTQTLSSSSRALTLGTASTVNANGVVDLSATTLTGAGTLDNSGTINLFANNTVAAPIDNGGTINVRNVGNAINGALTTRTGSLIEINNFNLNAHAALTVANGFTNDGTIKLRGDRANNAYTQTLTVSSGAIVNAAGATIVNEGPYGARTINAAIDNQGTIQVTGSRDLAVNGAAFINQATGIIEGDRNLAVIGTALQNGGTIAPGVSGKGILGLAGDIVQPASGAFNVDIEGVTAGSEYDRMNVSNSADLDGTLNISLLNGYQPVLGDSFVVLTYGSRIDSFTTITGREIGNGLYLNPHYRDNHLVLIAGNPPTTPTYDITASAGANGTISPDGIVTVTEGDDQIFTFTPDPGYEVADVVVNGISQGPLPDYTFSTVTSDHTISVTFAVETFTITASAGANGSISPAGAVSVTGGDDQVFTITPDPGYHVLDVLVDGQSVGPVTSFVFTSVVANHTIEASFEINTYTIAAQAGPGGSISPAGIIPITHGGSQLFTITPDANYEIADVVVDGVSQGPISDYEFVNLTGNAVIQAVFEPITWTITASAGAGGQISPSGTITIQQGSDLTFAIAAAPGYSISDVEVDGLSVGAVSSYDVTNIQADVTIQAFFVQNTYTITASAGPGGTITPSGAVSVAGGTTQSFDIVPDPGFAIDQVIVNGQNVGNPTDYTFVNVNDDHTIAASFQAQSFTISAAAGSGGSITPSGNVTVPYNGSQFFTISADVDYRIGEVYVNGQPQGAISEFEFVDVQGNQSIAAFFSPDNVTYTSLDLNVTVDIHGVYFVDNLTGYAVGADGTFLVTIDGGLTWSASVIIPGVTFYDVTVINGVIYAVGENGHICYSTDGVTWVDISGTPSVTFYSIAFSPVGFGFAVGANGVIYYWNGSTWTAQNLGSGIVFESVYAYGNYAYAVGANGVIYYWDGSAWIDVSLTVNVNFHGVYVLGNLGYAVGDGGVIYRTLDGGLTWTLLPDVNISLTIYDIVILSPDVAWAVCEGGVILQTSDGGATWTVIETGASGGLLGISAVGGSGWIVGAGGSGFTIESDIVTGTPQFTVNPANLDFGQVSVGYSGVQTVVVDNDGDGPLTVSAVSSNNSAFSVSPTSATVPAGGTQPFAITFAPANPGVANGTITFTHDAAGSPGTVSVTGEGVESGITFSALNIGVTVDWSAVFFVDANIGYVAGPGGIVYRTANGGATWVEVSLGVPVQLTNVWRIGGRTFLAGANGHLCYSDDDGATWTVFTTGTTADFYGLHFVNPFHGYAVGAGGTVRIWNGTSWSVADASTPETFHSVFTFGNVAWAVGTNGIICRYINGAWQPLTSTVTTTLLDVAFLNGSFGYAVGVGGTILRTLDGGVTWTALSSGVNVDITAIAILSADVAWVTCGDGQVLQTIDGGATWIRVPLGISERLTGIDFAGCRGTVVGESGRAYSFTTVYCDDTINPPYVRRFSGFRQRLYGVTINPDGTGWACGVGGTVLTTVDLGATWVFRNTGTFLDLTGIRAIGNALFITGINGLICVSYDGGITWQPFTTNVNITFWASSFTSPTAGWAVGGGGTICIWNGTAWVPQSTGGFSGTFYGVYAYGNTGWAVGSNGTICRYVGGSWVPQNAGGFTGTFYDVAFASETFGYVVGTDGTICRTFDGGGTWEPLTSGVSVDLRACVIVSPRVAYCQGDGGIVLKTEDCGDTWTAVDPGVADDLFALDIVDGEGILVGDLGEVFTFSQPALADYPLFRIDETSVDFGSGNVGVAQTTSVTVYNDGSAPLEILTVDSDEGSFAGPADPLTVPAGGSAELGLSFTASVTGSISGTLSITHSGSCEITALAVSGFGVSADYTVLNTGTVSHLRGVAFRDALTGWICGADGTLRRTVDGGGSWTSVFGPSARFFTDVKVIGDSIFLTGDDGHLCASHNGGDTWTVYPTNLSITFWASSFTSVNAGWAVGGGATICIWDGSNWSPQTVAGFTGTFYGVYAVGSTGWVVGENGAIFRYVDGNWVAQSSGFTGTFYDVAFGNEKCGLAVGSGGAIYCTKDGGDTWEPLDSGVTDDLYACVVVSPKVAYCAGDNGVILKTEDCGETWTPVSLDAAVPLHGLDIVAGQGFLVGDLGEAFTFSNPTITDIPLFSLSSDSLGFGDTDIALGVTQTVWIRNDGNADLTIDGIVSDTSLFTVTPDTGTVAAGDSLAITVRFQPTGIGAVTGRLFFTHGASCEVAELACGGTGVQIAQPCDIAGTVFSDGQPLAGVTVSLLDTAGMMLDGYAEVVTDENGNYRFDMVPPDSYQVSIIEPLGYAADANPKVIRVGSPSCDPVDFTLTEQVICNHARSAGYWKHQFRVHCRGRGRAHESEAELNDYIAKVHERYSIHFDLFQGVDTFHEWQDVLRPRCGPWNRYHRARRQVAALLLNMVSLKVGQYTEVTRDGKTAGDVLTYVSQLLSDGNDHNDNLAKNLAEHVNLQCPIPAGLVPDGSILYRGGRGGIDWNFEDLPETFALQQNYPNPFNPTTTIAFDLPRDERVTLVIYNALGQVVETVVDGHLAAGRYAIPFDAHHLASGIYFYQIRMKGFVKTRKMMLMK